MTWRQEIRNLKELVEQNQVQKAVDILQALFYGTDYDTEASLLEAMFNRAKNDSQLGVMTMQEYYVYCNQIIRGMLELSKSMNDELAVTIQRTIEEGLSIYEQLLITPTKAQSPTFKEAFKRLDQYRESFFMTDKAYIVLGHLFDNGKGTPMDKKIAAWCFEKAAAKAAA